MSSIKVQILITTSHRPSQRVRSFVKELSTVLPSSIKFSRGKATLQDLYYEAQVAGVKRVIIVSTRKGNPQSLSIYEPLPPPELRLSQLLSISLIGVRLRRETQNSVEKTTQSSSLCISVPSSAPIEVYSLIDSLSRGFLARLCLGGEHGTVETIVKLTYSKKICPLKLEFIDINTGKICGPMLKIRGIKDYVSGYRLYCSKES